MNGFTNCFLNLISPLTFNNVLEIGSGEGNVINLIKNLKKNEFNIYASDISIDILRDNIPREKNLFLIVFDINNIPLKQNTFDLIICSEILEHLKEVDNPLQEINRISKKYILFSVPREPIWHVLNIVRLRYLKNLGNTPGHLLHWSKKQFINLIKNRFKIIKTYSPLPWTMVLCEKR
ncbi:MAG: class I SAM-dependent methyltransferase [Candidatus Helarchaeota archaeon]|nr:class I SAM-dependent methyltransferase [Candidatus Helarchaeota archaeon]